MFDGGRVFPLSLISRFLFLKKLYSSWEKLVYKHNIWGDSIWQQIFSFTEIYNTTKFGNGECTKEEHLWAYFTHIYHVSFVTGVDRSYRSDDTEDAVTTDNPTTPFPTPPPTLVSPRSPIPLHRQASPFPLENINSRRMHFQTSQDRMRGNTGMDYFTSPMEIWFDRLVLLFSGEIIYSTSNKQKIANSTLTRPGRSRHRVGGMTSSSSATSCNSCTDNMMVPNGDISGYHDQNQQQRICLNAGELHFIIIFLKLL